ncbi:MAG: SDR family NAD(P)-dependent oxidoreductase [Alphaproteobacteria bacterium]|nr:SDR family NAD(P)-dependent oxidoreductase [Alphaproteobacteria bacterium]
MLPRSILITGASGGIGAALARGYASPGIALALGGRDGDRLARVAADCRAAGAGVDADAIDVTDRHAMAAWIAHADARAALDLVIANAGISAGAGGRGESPEQTRRIFATNVDGALNTVLPAIPLMQARGRGQIAIMSSIAGFRGLPGAPAYSASKAVVRIWGEGLRGQLARDGIGVSVICPGYVRTPMTAANRFPMPFLMDADRAARIIRRGLERNRARIAFPLPMYWAVLLLQALPPGWTDRLLARLPAKDAQRGS